MKTRWKFLRKSGRTIKSENGDMKWKMGEWNKVEGKLDMCTNGLHCSKTAYDAFTYVQGEVLALVECKGKHLSDENKECWEEQRIIKAYKWTKKDSLKLAIFSAELVLKNFEKKYPDDLRPRQAIEAAKKVLFKDTTKNRSAAESAAWSAAWSAAESARSAAESAWSAAESARSAAESAAWSAAWSAARSAAWSAESAVYKKLDKWMLNHLKELKQL
jgi:hypothetical protein